MRIKNDLYWIFLEGGPGIPPTLFCPGMFASLHTMSPIKALRDHVLYHRETFNMPAMCHIWESAYFLCLRTSFEYGALWDCRHYKGYHIWAPRYPSSLFFFLSILLTNGINTLIQHRFSIQPKSTHRLSRLLCSKSPLHYLRVLDPWSHTSHHRAEVNGLLCVGSCEKYIHTFFSLALCTGF